MVLAENVPLLLNNNSPTSAPMIAPQSANAIIAATQLPKINNHVGQQSPVASPAHTVNGNATSNAIQSMRTRLLTSTVNKYNLSNFQNSSEINNSSPSKIGKTTLMEWHSSWWSGCVRVGFYYWCCARIKIKKYTYFALIYFWMTIACSVSYFLIFLKHFFKNLRSFKPFWEAHWFILYDFWLFFFLKYFSKFFFAQTIKTLD